VTSDRAMLQLWITQNMRSLTLLAILSSLTGCGQTSPDLPKVTGSVFYNGQPAAGAMVIFNPASGEKGSLKRPSAQVADDGSFQLSTFGSSDGAIPGEYLVTVLWLEGGNEGEGGLGTGTKVKAGGGDRLKGRYSKPESSGLTATISEDDIVLPPFELK
jgi:predicted small lipoprotein YifL